jgi:hypothetical protein
VREIELTRGMITIVDDDDFELVSSYKWCIKNSSGLLYAHRALKGVDISLHRWLIDAPVGMDVDHINGNTLDNRRSNLRLCTRAENIRNSRKHMIAGVTSIYKGVRKCKHKWQALIVINRKTIIIGSKFVNEEDAAAAYNEAAIKYHGEYARLNVIGER